MENLTKPANCLKNPLIRDNNTPHDPLRSKEGIIHYVVIIIIHYVARATTNNTIIIIVAFSFLIFTFQHSNTWMFSYIEKSRRNTLNNVFQTLWVWNFSFSCWFSELVFLTFISVSYPFQDKFLRRIYPWKVTGNDIKMEKAKQGQPKKSFYFSFILYFGGLPNHLLVKPRVLYHKFGYVLLPNSKIACDLAWNVCRIK